MQPRAWEAGRTAWRGWQAKSRLPYCVRERGERDKTDKHRRPRPCEGHPWSVSKIEELMMSGQDGETLDILGWAAERPAQ